MILLLYTSTSLKQENDNFIQGLEIAKTCRKRKKTEITDILCNLFKLNLNAVFYAKSFSKKNHFFYETFNDQEHKLFRRYGNNYLK